MLNAATRWRFPCVLLTTLHKRLEHAGTSSCRKECHLWNSFGFELNIHPREMARNQFIQKRGVKTCEEGIWFVLGCKMMQGFAGERRKCDFRSPTLWCESCSAFADVACGVWRRFCSLSQSMPMLQGMHLKGQKWSEEHRTIWGEGIRVENGSFKTAFQFLLAYSLLRAQSSPSTLRKMLCLQSLFCSAAWGLRCRHWKAILLSCPVILRFLCQVSGSDCTWQNGFICAWGTAWERIVWGFHVWSDPKINPKWFNPKSSHGI